MADEGVLFEGLRLGSGQAFRALLDQHDEAMRRVARLYLGEAPAAPLIRRAWSIALPGLDMFAWHTTFRAWLFGILVTAGRAHAVTTQLPPTPPPHPAPSVEWPTLAWSAAWGEHGWAALDAAFARQPLNRREVLWLNDVEGWPTDEVLDTLGLMTAEGRRLLDAGRQDLTRAVVEHLGQPHRVTNEQVRVDGVVTLLRHSVRPSTPGPPDEQLRGIFTAWRRDRGLGPWRRLTWVARHSIRRARTSSARSSGAAHPGHHRRAG